jgi:hypothetical protein
MEIDELVSIVKEKFKDGKRRREIKEELYKQGIPEEEIDKAITKLQNDSIKQLPGISHLYQFIERLESKSNLTTPHMTFFLMIACILILVILAGSLYFIYDPLGTQSLVRDTRRQEDVKTIQTALSAYYQKHTVYPATLEELIPDFLPSVPHDPKTGDDYSYQTTDNASNYELCVSFELQQIQCLYARQEKSIIPVVPTATPVPTFVPHSASGSTQNGRDEAL